MGERAGGVACQALPCAGESSEVPSRFIMPGVPADWLREPLTTHQITKHLDGRLPIATLGSQTGSF